MTFDQQWLAASIQASANRPGTGLYGSGQLLIGKVKQITVQIEDGRVVGESSETPECEMSLSKTQAEAFFTGTLELSVEYMRGDLKPTGSTGAILAVIDGLDALAAQTGSG